MRRLDEIEARANAATEGPWEVGDRYHCQAADKCDCRQGYGPLIDTYQHHAWGTMHVHRSAEPWWDEGVRYRTDGGPPGDVVREIEPADAEFIAHARQDVPALVAALRGVISLHRIIRVGGAGGNIYEVCQTCNQPAPCAFIAAIHQHLGEDA